MAGLMRPTNAVFQTLAIATDLDRTEPNGCSVKAGRHDTSMAACLGVAYTARDDSERTEAGHFPSRSIFLVKCQGSIYLLKHTTCGIARPDPITINISGG